jgi:type II secretory pathway pseudopilin PulG
MRTSAARWWRRWARPVDAAVPDERRDDGFSLVETLMTIVLVGMVIVPTIEATMVSVRASSRAREAAEVETVLQNAADRVNRAPTNCDYSVYVKAAAQAKGWSPDLASASYQYYVPGTSALAATPGSWVSGACPNGARTPRLIQMVTITVTSESGKIQRTIRVVKSDV